MYLKAIITNGFKSFADKMEIKLNKETTCIVGPNGSGKSNIVDAVRWVLGEQSVKNLRGDGAMSDVIFSGSLSRKPKGSASVELVFDNSDHYLNIDYTEVSVKRRLFRSGETEYFINNSKCRLKDITSLFLDSGVSKESFNIISQGEVSKILSESKDDRRIVFEEAAGILKYKKRKEEAIRKLAKTKDAMDRVDDIILELEAQVKPLKSQSEKAILYKDTKKLLEELEIAITAYDIYNLSNEEEVLKKEKSDLEKEIAEIKNSTTFNSAINVKDKALLLSKEKDLDFFQKELVSKTEEIGKENLLLSSLQEKMKKKDEDQDLVKLRGLYDAKNKIKKTIDVNSEIIDNNKSEIDRKKEAINDLQNRLKSCQLSLKSYDVIYSKQERDILTKEHENSLLKLEIERGNNLPKAIDKILKTNSLNGIYDIIGNVLKTKDTYLRCLDVAIASSKNFVIVKAYECAKEAVRFLKNENLGRATFFPIDTIKYRYIDKETKSLLDKMEGFVGVLADLVSCDVIYKNIIYNQLGLVVVADTLDNANIISKKIGRKYKVITLTGDVINVGGSISGGSTYKGRSKIMIMQEINNNQLIINNLQEKNKDILNNIETLKTDVNTINDEIFAVSREIKILEEVLRDKEKEKDVNLEQLEKIVDEISNLESDDKTLNEKEATLINKLGELNSYKDKVTLKIDNLKKEIKEIKDKIEADEEDSKYKNSLLRKKEEKKNEIEIKLNRLDVKLDANLEILSSEYAITYEKARRDYPLEVDYLEGKNKVNSYKAKIKSLGMVNLGAIEEYERVSTRYNFLLHQKEDLEHAKATLFEIMDEMDKVMTEEFLKTFDSIKEEFSKVFKELFHGGSASLSLTDSSDVLNTGIDIVASPPGKKLSTISLLSGGEKTLTAISLLFAIINVRKIPFCIFDEVEAALDEANVIEFGKYLNSYKDKTQFLIITHKKKTMEYADTLYGITMQESGVSKLVSVKLTNYEELI